jgi:glycosyltransferase involved in cell wall biosynthesis
MRVAVLCGYPLDQLPEAAGRFGPSQHATSWLVELPGEFAKLRGLEMHWITLRDDVGESVAFPAQGGIFHVLPTTRSGRASSWYRDDLQTLRCCLAEIRPQVVHGWGTEDVYALAAVTSGYPHLISMQGILSYYCLRNRMKPRDYFQALLELWCLRKAERVTVESEWGRRILRKRRWQGPIDLVEYGVRHSFFEVPWRPDPERPAAVFIGSIHPRKGIADLIKAFRDVPGILRVIGRGEESYVRRLKQSAPTNVEWLGELDVAEVQKQLSKAWCLALPTRADTSPNVVKEARVIGLPVITTSAGGQAAYVEHMKDGLFVPCGKREDLTQALRQLFAHFGLVLQMGNLGRSRYREIFSPHNTATAFGLLYKNLGYHVGLPCKVE